MQSIEFAESNVVYAKSQPQYGNLPVCEHEDGMVTSVWKPSFKERLQLLFGAKIYHAQLTFGNKLQPIKLTLNKSEAITIK